YCAPGDRGEPRADRAAARGRRGTLPERPRARDTAATAAARPAHIRGALPALLTQGQQTGVALNEMAKSGFRLDEETVRLIAREEARRTRWGRVALWIGALSLAVLAMIALGH